MPKFACGAKHHSMTEKFTRIITSSEEGSLERQCGDVLGRIGNVLSLWETLTILSSPYLDTSWYQSFIWQNSKTRLMT